MKVLHVLASDTRRGAETFARDLVESLHRLGVVQQVVVLRGSTEGGLVFDVPTIYLDSHPRHRGISWRALWALRKLLVAWQPDVVQAHGGEALKLCSLARPRGRGKIVYRRIGLTTRSGDRGLRSVFHGRLIRGAARVILVAEALRDEIVDIFHACPERVVMIPNGIDRRRVLSVRGRKNVRADLGIPPDALLVLSLGALTWEKNPLAQLEVAANVLEEVPDARFLVVGDGVLRSEVEARVKALGLGASVTLLGSRGDVGELLVASDVLLFTSCSEGMPASLIEAGMAGIPVVAFAVGGVAEVIKDGETGWLAKAGDTGQLAQFIVKLWRDPAAGAAMGRKARESYSDRFGIDSIAERYLRVYREVSKQ